jgi:hypothetical protein
MIRTYQYQESPIQFDEVDGQIMANATLMCQVFKKKTINWLRLEGTKEYMDAIVRKNHLSLDQLVTTRPGSPENGGGSWIHEKLIIRLSQWLNPDFALWCDEKIAEYYRTGQIAKKENIPPSSMAEAMLQSSRLVTQIIELQISTSKRVEEIETKQIAIEEKVQKMEAVQKESELSLFDAPVSTEEIKELTLKAQVKQLVAKYARAMNVPYKAVYDSIYSDLNYRYNILLRGRKKREKETWLDVAERTGCLNYLFIIISDKVTRATKRA